MSPEQALGRTDRIGPWTDVFGLGGLLYHLLALRPPYRGASRISVARQAREADYLPIRQLAPATPRGLERIVHRAMAADPERRYRTAAELEAALRQFLARHRLAAALLALGLVSSALAPALLSDRGVPAWPGRARPVAPAPTAAGPSPVPTPTSSPSRGREPAAMPRILALRVEAFRGEPPAALGPIGASARPVRVDDDVRVSVRLDAPAYCYLIALDPDGKVELCHPARGDRPSPRSDEVHFPAAALMCFGLTDGPGLQAFVALASSRPLPPFEDWGRREELRRLWRPAEADMVWRYADRNFTTESPVTRGTLRRRGGAGLPIPFREVCEYLATLPDIEAIQAIAFPVRPGIEPFGTGLSRSVSLRDLLLVIQDPGHENHHAVSGFVPTSRRPG
jgi:hypothetical protein